MSWVAVAIGGAAVVGAGASIAAADKQSNAASQASNQALQQYQQTRSDLQPWAQAGQTGLTSLMNLSGMAGNQPLSVPQALINQPIAPDPLTAPAPTAPKSRTRDDAYQAALQQHIQTYGRGLNKYSNMATFNQNVDNLFAQYKSEDAAAQQKYQQAMAQYDQQKAAAQKAQQDYQQQLQSYQTQQQQLQAYQTQQQQQQQMQAQQAPQPTMGQAQATAQALNPAVPASAQLAGSTQNAPLLAPFSLSDFKESPAYQFNLQQGMDAINKGAASRGNYYAPQTLMDVGRFSQGLASNEFNNAYNQYNNNQSNVWNRLFSLSGTGQNAAAQTGAFGANATNVAGQSQIGGANAQAAGIVGASNALTGGGSDLYNLWLSRQILQQSSYQPRDLP